MTMRRHSRHVLVILAVAFAGLGGGCVDFVRDGVVAGLTAGISDVVATAFEEGLVGWTGDD